jgi:hypothetical protein
MKQQVEQRKNRQADIAPRTFYRPDPNCSEFGSWFFLTAELGEVGPFDSREDAREALDFSLELSPDSKMAKKKQTKKKKALH